MKSMLTPLNPEVIRELIRIKIMEEEKAGKIRKDYAFKFFEEQTKFKECKGDNLSIELKTINNKCNK